MTQIIRTRSGQIIEPRRESSGDVASRVFELLERGTPADEIVIALTLSPDVVESLLRTWARLRELVPMTAEGSDALRRVLYEHRVFKTGTELLAALRSFSMHVSLVCRECHTGSADYCLACPAQEARRAGRRKPRRTTRRDSAPSDPTEGDQAPGFFSAELEAAILRARRE